MTSNVGGVDRILRILAGVVLLALGAFGPLGWWGLVGLVPLATGLTRSCPDCVRATRVQLFGAGDSRPGVPACGVHTQGDRGLAAT
ncbi:MAG TPA: DUF2892 domain-containing protein [Falsiroseomonas sp.]|nr:DUF2892 domain-containing protein [Falsiroseomonas sp.]